MSIKVMMAAPFQVNGRYQGGISMVVNSVMEAGDILAQEQMDIIAFNTCRLQRNSDGMGSLSIENLKNFGLIYRDVVTEVKAAAPDVFYMHSSLRLALLKDLLVLRRVKRAAGCRTVLHIHYADYEKIMTGKQPFDALMLRLMKKYVDVVVFLSEKTKEQFVAQGLQAEKCRVIYNFSTLTCPEAKVRPDAGSDALQLLFVGSIDERKGIFDVLECLTQMDGKIQLHVCGGAQTLEENARFEAYREKLGDRLIFHGYVSGEEKKRVFLQADALVLPSYGEGLPMVILEAFSAGNAVITSDVGAIPEIVSEDSGFVIRPGDQAALRKAIESYAGSRELLEKHQEHNLASAQQYSLQVFIAKIAAACRGV